MSGLTQFWAGSDAITRIVAVMLLAMSVSAWVVILWKGWLLRRVRADMERAIPAFWALPPKLVTGAGAAGGIALINTLGQLGGIVSPVMVGRIKDMTGSTTPALYVIGCLSLLCAAILLYGLPATLRRREERAAQEANGQLAPAHASR